MATSITLQEKSSVSFSRKSGIILVLFVLQFSWVFGQVQYIDSLKDVIKAYQPNDTTYINILNEIALTYWSVSADSVLRLSNRSLELAKQIHYLKGQAEAIKNIGVANWGRGNYDSALYYYQLAIPMAEKSGYLKGLSGCYNNIAIIYNNQAKYDLALEYHERALKIREKIGDKKSISTSLNNIGVIYEQLGQLSTALEYQFKGLRMREDIKDQFGISMSYNNIANLYGRQNQFEKALEYQQSALKLRNEIGDQHGISQSLDNIGNIYARERNDSLALVYFNRVLNLQETQLHDEYVIAKLLLSIADIYARARQDSIAEEYYRRSKSKMETMNDANGLIGVLVGLAELDLKRKKFGDAEKLAQQSLTLSMKIKNTERIFEAHQLLAVIFESMNSATKALHHYKLFKAYSDSVLNDETQKRTAQLQAQYEFQKKEAQLREEQQLLEVNYQKTTDRQRLFILVTIVVIISISIITLLVIRSRRRLKIAFVRLEEANTLIKNQNDQLEEMNSAKEQLLSIVSHDARGPLQSLQGMIQLLSQNAVSLEEAKFMFSSLSGQISHVTNFLETLLQWLKNQFAQAQPEVSTIDIGTLVPQVMELLAPLTYAKKLNISYEGAEPDMTAIADEEMVRTILRNLVSNAIKYSEESGSIRIVTELASNFIKISVIDNGVGISKENLEKLLGSTHITTKGTNAEIGTGIGVQLCKKLVQANHGKFGIESEEEKGSSFWFTLPSEIIT